MHNKFIFRSVLTLFLATLLASTSLAQEVVQKYRRADGSIFYTNLPEGMIRTPDMELLEIRVFRQYHYSKSPRPLTAERRDAYDSFIVDASRTWQLDFATIKAIIHAESAFDTEAVSRAGARGLMQLMPGTARDMRVRNLRDPEENINGGARYFRMMLDRFEGNVPFALAAYNAGPANVDKYGGIPPFEETQSYVKQVSLLTEQYRNQGGI